MLCVVVSRPDEASVAIGDQLRELVEDESVSVGGRAAAGWRAPGLSVREFDTRHLDLVEPAAAFPDTDLLVFASRHAGETGPLLSAHHTGNFGPADHGGEPNSLARAAPNAHAAAIEALVEHAPTGYDVAIECTHHGPTHVGAPSLFVELGSGPDQWADPAAAEAVARTILDLRGVSADGEPDQDGSRRHLVGFGGGHYGPRFERVLRDTDWAIGHIAADWGLEALGDPTTATGRAVIGTAFEQSTADYGLVAGDRPDLRSVIGELGYRAVSETWVRETNGVPLATVKAIEDALGSVSEGVRFGDLATVGPTELRVQSLPADLVDATVGIDRDHTRTAVSNTTVAFETTEGGTRPANRIALGPENDRETVIERLVGVLEAGFDSVDREGAELVATETAFDPERAATLGVPEGPKFGRLAAGETVTVDGREIPPSAVRTERERRFNLR